jgi:hypothetical protein
MSKSRHVKRSGYRSTRVGGAVMALALLGVSGQVGLAAPAGAATAKATAGPDVLYVDGNQPATNATCTQAAPCATLAKAVTAATQNHAGKDVVILLTPGIYSGHTTINASTLTSLTVAATPGATAATVLSGGGSGGSVLRIVDTAVDQGTVNIVGLTIAAGAADGTGVQGSGGGIAIANSTVNIINTTVAYNAANISGGGVASLASNLTILNSTLAANTIGDAASPNGENLALLTGQNPPAPGFAHLFGTTVSGGSIRNQLADFTLQASILNGVACSGAGGFPTDQGYNVESDPAGTCGLTAPTSVTGSSTIGLPTDPTLNNVAGPFTLALPPTSSAIGVVPGTICESALGNADARNLPRPGVSGASTCDAGAFELQTPGAPTNVQAVAGNASTDVTYTAASPGDAPIASYTVTATDTTAASTPVTCTAEGTATTCHVTGLTNGHVYSFTVTASNGTQSGPASAAVTATPAGPPGAPTDLRTAAGNGTVSVSFDAPADNGGATISGYQVTATTGGTAAGSCTPEAGATSCTVTGLTNGTTYTFTATATNAVGTGAASDSVTATPMAAKPGAPTDLVANPADGSVTVSFTAPANDGGAPITGYTVTATDPNNVAAGSCPATTVAGCTINGLTNGTTYTFTATATNSAGESVASEPVLAIPAAVPDAPTGLTTEPGNHSVQISFTPPAHNGGTPITGYLVTATNGTSPAGSCTPAAEAQSSTVNGVNNGTAST